MSEGCLRSSVRCSELRFVSPFFNQYIKFSDKLPKFIYFCNLTVKLDCIIIVFNLAEQTWMTKMTPWLLLCEYFSVVADHDSHLVKKRCLATKTGVCRWWSVAFFLFFLNYFFPTCQTSFTSFVLWSSFWYSRTSRPTALHIWDASCPRGLNHWQ